MLYGAEEHQIHFGRKFYLDKQYGYWISTDYPRIRAHRWVWINHYGEIPDGYHIHHIDEDKSNNKVENLQLIIAFDHLSMHVDDNKKKKLRAWAAKIRPLTKAWHCSEEGRAWHKANGINGWTKRKKIRIKCKKCYLEATTKTFHQEFCSNKCKSAWRRKSGIDNEERFCKRCNTKFVVNKYAKTEFCSRSCSKIGWNSK